MHGVGQGRHKIPNIKKHTCRDNGTKSCNVYTDVHDYVGKGAKFKTKLKAGQGRHVKNSSGSADKVLIDGLAKFKSPFVGKV